jgi:cellulose synthase/poly-beta-1,6-N-acetylglucosamine synthase-like glycosyltransferase
MTVFVFFLLLLLTIYSYAIYPSLLWVMQRIVSRPWKRKVQTPSITIIISVYNEAQVIRAKVQNALDLIYPDELLEVIVNSDGSTDCTPDIVREIDDPRVVLKCFERLGKTECLNRVVPQAKGDIVLFTDANAIFPPDLLLHVAANFVDPEVGLVTGWTRYVKPGGGEELTGLYAKLERDTKYWESRIASCVGADGAVFAIRKVLYQPLGADDINDFIIPLNVVGKGYRVLLDPEVFCREEAADSDQKAFRRQVRITTRTLWALRRKHEFLNFRKHGFFAFFLLSHKVLRLSAPIFFLLAFLLNMALLCSELIFSLPLAGFVLFFVLGSLHAIGLTENHVAAVCKFLLLTFGAQLLGWARMAVGVRDKLWTPQR